MIDRRPFLVLAGLTGLAGLAACTASPTPLPDPTTGSTSPQTTSPGSAPPSISPPTTPAPSTTPPQTTGASPTTPGVPTEITGGLTAPWSIAFHGTTALISERDSGRVLELADDGSTRVVATIAGVVPQGEGGLLGLAVRDDHLFVYFTGSDDNRIVRHDLTGQPGALALANPQPILTGIPRAFTHNGGRLAFGPDGMLHATVGDAGVRANAQDRDSLSGKILRMTPEGKPPSDNPFPGSLVYTLGHRNPQGLAWAPDGTMYAAEFGQNTWDELNVISPGGNYGWPTVEGIGRRGGFIDPVQQWATDDASPSGIAIAGDAIWIANLKGQRLRRVPLSDTRSSSELFVGDETLGRLRDVVVAPDGALWVLTNNTDGRGSPRPGDDRITRITPS